MIKTLPNLMQMAAISAAVQAYLDESNQDVFPINQVSPWKISLMPNFTAPFSRRLIGWTGRKR